jgi:hypothetical protein
MLHESTRIGIQGTAELDVLSSYGPINDNGLVMQAVYENGRRKCRPSNGAANSIFEGFSKGVVGSGPPSTIPFAEIIKTNSAGVARLSFPLSAAGILTVIPGDGYGNAPLSPTASPTTAPADGTHYQLAADNQTITVQAVNSDLFVVYKYSPTTENARWIYGDFIPGNQAHNQFGRIGVVFNGIVVTDMFDPAVNWASVTDASDANRLRGGANGLVTVGGNGCLIPGKVVSIPTPDLPFLAIAVGDAP